MKTKPRLTDPTSVPAHMRGDIENRNRNIEANETLCGRCSGTGNELLSMYRKCQACGGTGVSRGNEANFKD